MPIRLISIGQGVKQSRLKTPEEDILQTEFHLIEIINNPVEIYISADNDFPIQFQFYIGNKTNHRISLSI